MVAPGAAGNERGSLLLPLICHTDCSWAPNELGKIWNATRQIFSEGFCGGCAAELSTLRGRKAHLEHGKGENKQSWHVLRLQAEPENLACCCRHPPPSRTGLGNYIII